MNKIDEFTVKQSIGSDSLVEVFEDIQNNVFGTKKFLIFKTDQVLTSNSGRSFDVNQAIRDYAIQNGYYPKETLRDTVICKFDAQSYSIQEALKTNKAIKGDARYLAALADTAEKATDIQDGYGRKIAILKEAIRKLEDDARAEFAQIDQELHVIKNEIAKDFVIPAAIMDRDLKRMMQPEKIYSLNHYKRYDVTIPDGLFDLL